MPRIDTPLSDVFPAYDDLMADPDRRRITVEHALTMTMGLEWNESDFPYGSSRNSETAMWGAPDKYRYVLRQSIVADPGNSFQYSGGATVLLGDFITRGVGKSLLEYATKKLFDPMSITDVKWTKVRGDEDPAGGLRMKPRELAKIGRLVLNQGRWKGNQIVPQKWLESSFQESATVDEKFKYGYPWWLGPYDQRTRNIGIGRLISEYGHERTPPYIGNLLNKQL